MQGRHVLEVADCAGEVDADVEVEAAYVKHSSQSSLFEVPADSGIDYCASAEPLIVAKPHASGEARARRTDNALVGQQRRSPRRKGGDADLSVQVSSFHPSYKVTDCAPRSLFLLGDNYLALLDRCVLRQPKSKFGGRVRAVTCRVHRFGKQ